MAQQNSASATPAKAWEKRGWRAYPRVQMPDYPDQAALNAVEAQLAKFPPLVFAGEARRLKQSLAEVAAGRAFLLQGGDCAESFSEFSADNIRDTFKVMLQMAVVLTWGAQLPVVKVGRMAGQFAKPRSAPTEVIGGQELPSYRGDIINGFDFTPEARIPDPQRMLWAYTQAAASLNLLRAFSTGGYADIHRVQSWISDFTGGEEAARYRDIADRISDAMAFMAAAGVTSDTAHDLAKVDFYTSHEALLLEYEEALARIDSTTGLPVAGSGHMLWIGDRTRQVDGAHVEYLRGVRNPIAIKVGPSVTPDQLLRLIDVLNPHDEPGRLSFIHRMGATQIAEKLPPLLDAVKRDGRRVLWVCDAMHGNTESTANGFKTRRFDNVRGEVEMSFDLHAAAGTRLGGVHLELTGEDVTECIGGARELTERDLERAYRSTVDPRLNYEQSLEIAMAIVRKQEQVR